MIREYTETEGEYTIEVTTVTPFNNGIPERIAAISFTIDRTVKVRGSLFSGD